MSKSNQYLHLSSTHQLLSGSTYSVANIRQSSSRGVRSLVVVGRVKMCWWSLQHYDPSCLFVSFKGRLSPLPGWHVYICSIPHSPESPLQTSLQWHDIETRTLIHFTGSLKQDWSTSVPLTPYPSRWYDILGVKMPIAIGEAIATERSWRMFRSVIF